MKLYSCFSEFGIIVLQNCGFFDFEILSVFLHMDDFVSLMDIYLCKIVEF